MTKAVAKQTSSPISAQALSTVLLHGDLSVLKPEDKVIYYNKVCEVVGLNPLTTPFNYIKLNGKEVLYANKGCGEQLRSVHKISLEVTQIQTVSDVYVVVVKATDPDGRIDSATGAVSIKGLFGEALANAFMKAETKAKRRATLSICGLNMLDETEVASVPGAEPTSSPPLSHPTVPPKKETETAPAKDSRQAVGYDILSAQKMLKLSKEELAEWAQNKFGKDSLKDLTLTEMTSFRDELRAEITAGGK